MSLVLRACDEKSIFFVWQVDAYEAQKQELVAENAELRALLRSMQVCSN
jgi:hypothetical protein